MFVRTRRFIIGYFDIEKNCDEYEKMADGYDGRKLIETLGNFVSQGNSVLELGMGPGKDLDMLCEIYQATGSDKSEVFVRRYRIRVPDADVLVLDAVSIDTEAQYDAIYSNKILHHLTKDELKKSLKRQALVVKPGGYLLHSFWHGDRIEKHEGLLFNYYTIQTLKNYIPEDLEVVHFEIYKEMEVDDSLLVIFRRRE